MKKDSFKLIIMSVAVICIVIAGIMVPGIVLEANQKSEHDHVAKVPKSYLPSGSVMAKEASANLKLSEKLSLIDRKSTRLNSSHITRSRMPSSA